MNILEAITDHHLLGATLKGGDTWKPWMTFLKVVYGLKLDTEDLKRFRQHPGRELPRPGGYPESCCIVGCQSGKSQVAALVGVYEAMNAVLTGQRNVYVPLIAQDLRGAQRALFGYVREAVTASPVFSHEVIRETAEGLELTGGVTLCVYPTDGRPTDTEMLRAARTRTATTGGKVLILSSPYASTGALWNGPNVSCRMSTKRYTSTNSSLSTSLCFEIGSVGGSVV